MEQDFFEAQSTLSRKKAEIVAKYVWAWGTALKNHLGRTSNGPRLCYVDLFAGRGEYVQGAESTPILVLQKIIGDPFLRENLATHFNDNCTEFVLRLKEAVGKQQGLDMLAYEPRFYCEDANPGIVRSANGGRKIPSLVFIDPCGPRGLTQELFAAAIESWGSDCIFFFNLEKMNRDISNPQVPDSDLAPIIGIERLNLLRQQFAGYNTPLQRANAIVAQVVDAVEEVGAQFILQYAIQDEHRRTLRYIVFFSKHRRGYDIMKSIMAGASSDRLRSQGSFGFAEPDEVQCSMFEQIIPFHDELADQLTTHFAGRTLTVSEIYDEHNVGTNFVVHDYKWALLILEESGKVVVSPIRDARPFRYDKPTMSDSTSIAFPSLTGRQ